MHVTVTHVCACTYLLVFLLSLLVTQGAVVKDMVAAIAPVVILILVRKEEKEEEKEERRGLRKRVFQAEEGLSPVEEDSAVRTTMVRKSSINGAVCRHTCKPN